MWQENFRISENLKFYSMNPTVLIVDDQLENVAHIISALEARGCDVLRAENSEKAREILRQTIVDLILLDVCLDPEDDTNRDGVILASNCALSGRTEKESAICPEAPIVFMSRPAVLDDARSVLSMFNRRRDLAAGKIRLAEAYVDKDEIDELIFIASDLLRDRGFLLDEKQNTERFQMSDEALINEQIAKKFDKRFHANVVSPLDQVLRIILQLSAPELATTTHVRICEVSTGRSRSIVISVRNHNVTGTILDRIFKIGASNTIEMEVGNYLKNVPKLLHGGNYPLMTGFVHSRNLGGIAYSELGEGEGIPPSLGNRFFDCDEAVLYRHLDNIYHSIICDSGAISKVNQKPFAARYAKRFQNLEPTHSHFDRVKGMISNSKNFAMVVKKDEANSDKRAIDQFMYFKAEGEAKLRLHNPLWVVKHGMRRQLSTGYTECIVHGDLHPDNILLVRDESIFLIDFTHTESNHACLDYLVMDAMIRSQLLRRLFMTIMDEKGPAIVRSLMYCWIEIEVHINNDEWSKAFEKACTFPKPESFKRLVGCCRWLRESARSKCFSEPGSFYSTGFGLLCYSFLALSDKSAVDEMTRTVLIACSGLSFNRVFEGEKQPRWIEDDASDEELDERLAKSLVLWRGWLTRQNRGVIARAVKAFAKQGGNENLSPFEKIKTEWPKSTGASQKIVSEVQSQEVKEILKDNENIGSFVIFKLFLNLATKLLPDISRLKALNDANEEIQKAVFA